MPPPTQDPPLLCMQCGYPIEDRPGGACPECGLRLDSLQLRQSHLVRELAENGAAYTLEQKACLGAAIVIYVIVLGTLSASLPVAFGGLVVLIAWVGLGLGLGRMLALLAPPHLRVVMREAWAGAMPWVHGPWLIIIPAGLVLCVVAIIDRAASLQGSITSAAILGALILWLVVDLLMVIAACDVWGQVLRRLTGAGRTNTLAGETLSVLALLAMTLGSVVLGAAGGGLAIGVALIIAG